MNTLQKNIFDSTCPACGHHVAVRFFDGGTQPLATLGWPDSSEQAIAMEKLPLAFVRCVECGHVYNREFCYEHVPYSDHPNLMFNQSEKWSDHLDAVCDLILQNLPPQPTVVEIGCGTGHFLASMAKKCPEGRFIGFDPNIFVGSDSPLIEARQEYFDPIVHLNELHPDLVMSRHVLEHLSNPLGFIQRLSFAAEWYSCPTRLFLEVPCIDPIFEGNRINDFYYEHNSHFTVNSFSRMLTRCASKVLLVETSYGNEVVYGLAALGDETSRRNHAVESLRFQKKTVEKKEQIQQQLAALLKQGKTVAIWGGTGKGAAFINFFNLNKELFPLVVDSDPDKVGTFVPGAGQKILFRDQLKEHAVDIILIPTQWRAADIVQEIEKCKITCEKILIEHDGNLISFAGAPNPYNMKMKK